MPHKIGFVDNSGGKLAHQNMLVEIMNLTTANGWTLMRYDDTGSEHELILMAPGMSGTDQIYIGLKTYHSVNSDYYNIIGACFTGYVPANSFETQPGYMFSGVPAHNQRIDYWLTVNGQRLVLLMKVGTPVYESLYLGKIVPYARPTQYPYPLVVGGMLDGRPATRFSDTAHSCWVKGNRKNMRLLLNSGEWSQVECWPWNNTDMLASNATSYAIRDTGGAMPVLPIILSSALGMYGELDGVHYTTGFDNVVENTYEINGSTYVVAQDVYRTGFHDYYAIRMDD